MTKKILFVLVLISFFLAACSAAINVRGKVASVSSGKFIYEDGSLISEYRADIDMVWRSCEKTVTELNAANVQKKRTISTGTINSVIQDEKVRIIVQYMDKDLTSVSVFVGVAGNKMASRLIHNKIAQNIANK